MNIRTLIIVMTLAVAPAAAHPDCHREAELAGVRIAAQPLRSLGQDSDYLYYILTRLDPDDVELVDVELSICGRTEDVVMCHPQPCGIGEVDGGIVRWTLRPLEFERSFGVRLTDVPFGERADRSIVVKRAGVSSLEMICGLPCKQVEISEEKSEVKLLPRIALGLILGLIAVMLFLVIVKAIR